MRIVCGVAVPDDLGIVVHGEEDYKALSSISRKITVFVINKFKLVAFLVTDVQTRKLVSQEFNQAELETFMAEVFRGAKSAVFVNPRDIKDYLQFAINHEVGHVKMGFHAGLRAEIKKSKLRTYLDFYSHYLLANDEIKADTYAFHRSPLSQSIAFKESLETELSNGVYDKNYIDKVFTAPEERIRNLEKLIAYGK